MTNHTNNLSDEAQKVIAALRREADSTITEIDDLQKKIKTFAAETQPTIDEISADIDQFEKDIDAADEQSDEELDRLLIDAAEVIADVPDAELDEIEAKINAL